jgi:MYXO-CTERM domain-containing protein
LARQHLLRIVACALAVAVWAIPHASRACSCKLLPPPATALEAADAVFEARVEAVSAEPGGPDSVIGMVRYDLEVLRAWKGEPGATTRVSSRSSGAACGRSLTIGKVYLIYASRRDDGELMDTMCSRTRLASMADEDLAVLGPGSSPTARPPVTAPTSREPPRIPPPAPDLGPTPVGRRGCAVAGDAAPMLPAAVLLALAWRRRRQADS